MAGLAAGTLFGQFEVYGVAGRGGMGVVYRARQLRLERDVALKVISHEIADGPDFRERFARESRLAAAIDHPHVVSVYDAGEDDGELYIAMQWIEGSDLRTLLDEGGELPPRRAVTIAAQIADALEAAHQKGLVHRDVKPGNILVRRIGGHDHAYLTDFGVARPLDSDSSSLTRTGQVLGTAGYLAPEQIRGETGDHRCDVYALGCVLFEMLTGEQPFSAENEMALRWAHANDPRPTPSERRPELGERFDAVVVQAMAIDPTERFQSGAALAKALEAIQRGVPAAGTAATEVIAGATRPGYQRGRGYEATAPAPATPIPPNRPGYRATPSPPPHSRSPARTFGTALLGTLAVAGIAVGAFAASGGFGGSSSHHQRGVTAPAGQSSSGSKAAQSPSTPAETQNGVSKPVGPSSSGSAPPHPVSYTDYSAPGYTAKVPTGGGWAAPAQSEPTPGRLYRTSIRGPNGLFAIIDYTPNDKAMFGNYPYESRTEVNQPAIGSATRYVFTGGKLAGCVQSPCVDYIMNDAASGHGFGVAAGGGDFATAAAVAKTIAESLTPSGG